MTEPAPSSPPEKRRRRWRGCLLTGVALAFLGLVVPGFFLGEGWYDFLTERAWMGRRIATILVSGPVTFLIRVVPAVSFNLQLAACGLTAFGLAIWLIHRLAASVGRPWPLRRSARLALLVPAMFGAAVAAVGIVHQTGWLFGGIIVAKDWDDDLIARQMDQLRSARSRFIEEHRRPPETLSELIDDDAYFELWSVKKNGWRLVPRPPADGNPILFVAPSRWRSGKMLVCRVHEVDGESANHPPVTPEADVIAELRAQKRLR